MMTQVKDIKVGQYVQGSNPDHILRVENTLPTPGGQTMRFSLHGVLTEFVEYGPYESFAVVTLH